MSATRQQHEDPLQEWVLQKIEATAAKVRRIRLYPLVLLALGVACLVSFAFNGLMSDGGSGWSFAIAMQRSPHQLITAAICFHGLAHRNRTNSA